MVAPIFFFNLRCPRALALVKLINTSSFQALLNCVQRPEDPGGHAQGLRKHADTMGIQVSLLGHKKSHKTKST